VNEYQLKGKLMQICSCGTCDLQAVY